MVYNFLTIYGTTNIYILLKMDQDLINAAYDLGATKIKYLQKLFSH